MGEMTNCEICGRFRDCGWYWVESNYENWTSINFAICQKCKHEFEERVRGLVKGKDINEMLEL